MPLKFSTEPAADPGGHFLMPCLRIQAICSGVVSMVSHHTTFRNALKQVPGCHPAVDFPHGPRLGNFRPSTGKQRGIDANACYRGVQPLRASNRSRPAAVASGRRFTGGAGNINRQHFKRAPFVRCSSRYLCTSRQTQSPHMPCV